MTVTILEAWLCFNESYSAEHVFSELYSQPVKFHEHFIGYEMLMEFHGL